MDSVGQKSLSNTNKYDNTIPLHLYRENLISNNVMGYLNPSDLVERPRTLISVFANKTFFKIKQSHRYKKLKEFQDIIVPRCRFKMRNITLVLVVLILTTVASQTFQYSRGWTNGKRDHKTDQAHDQSLTPCQIERLKFLLLRKRFSERV